MPDLGRGFCYLFPIDGSGTEHLHICVAGPTWFPATLVVVKILTWKTLRAPDDFLDIRPKEHPFIIHSSQADLHEALAVQVALVEQYLSTGLAVPKEPAGTPLLNRLAAALKKSPRTKRDVKRLLQAAGL